MPGTIVKKLGPVTYQVDLGSGCLVKRHIDQLTKRAEPQPETSAPPTNQEDYCQYPDTTELPVQEPVDLPPHPPARYPQRVRKPPDRFM